MIQQATAPHTIIKGSVHAWMCYDSIHTLPVKRWFEILKTGQLHHLFISGSGRINALVVDTWNNLQQEYFDEFGVDDSFKIRLQKMKKLTELNCDFIITENRFLLNQIAQIELELNHGAADQVTSYFKIKDAIEKHRKYYIDLDKITVVEWGHMVKDFEEAGRKAKADSMKQKHSGRVRN